MGVIGGYYECGEYAIIRMSRKDTAQQSGQRKWSITSNGNMALNHGQPSTDWGEKVNAVQLG